MLLPMRSTLMISAAVRSSFLRVADAPVRAHRIVAGSPFTSGITATPVSKPEKPERQLGKQTSGATSIITRSCRAPATARRASCEKRSG